MWMSLSVSPSRSFVTGTPVQADTISAMSSASTSSLSRRPGPWSASSAASRSVRRACSSGNVPYLSCAALS